MYNTCRPVITVSLVNKPSQPQPNIIENEDGKEELETSSVRSKSRQTQHSLSKRYNNTCT